MSRRTRNLYVWKTKADDGRKRKVEAQLFGSKWSFRDWCAGDEEWTEIKRPSLEDLEELETMIFNKYQRKHVSYDQLVGIRKIIAERRPSSD